MDKHITVEDVLRIHAEIMEERKQNPHVHHTQRLGQKVVNYVRFEKLKRSKFPTPEAYFSAIEHYIFNMSDAEFMEALQSD
jgi:hypothetical protein